MIIDALMQHPTARHSTQPMFDSLRRWTRTESLRTAKMPLSQTIATMDEGGVSLGLISAWSARWAR
jgi:uncharacterized protein